jgi:hypothetical protein
MVASGNHMEENSCSSAIRDHQTEPDPLKGLVAGILGGLIGTWFMSEYQGMWTRVVNGQESQSAGGRHDARDWQEKSEGTNANEQASQAVARRTAGRELTERELEVAAPLMHYTFGATVSGLYGALVERAPGATAGTGTAFGTAVWIGGDEVAMPLIGWSHPSRQPFEAHLQSFTAHLVFGFTTEIARRLIRAQLH